MGERILSLPLRACEIPRSVSKTVNNFFHHCLHLQPKKKATRAAEMMSVERVAIFWVVNASSGEKSCLQFSIPTGSGAGGEGGVSHTLKYSMRNGSSQETEDESPSVRFFYVTPSTG